METTTPAQKAVPSTFDEAFQNMEATADEKAELGVDDDVAPLPAEKKTNVDNPSDVPDWFTMPPGFVIPPHKEIIFLRFRAAWTDRPDKGERMCMLWPLSDADEKLALKRTRGEPARGLSELSKQLIRAVDGCRADWTGQPGPGSVERFWDEIGSKCRQLIQNYYAKTHTLSNEEKYDFLGNCFVVKNATVSGA